jgi:C-terminal processing protease CtpA/Prc
MKKTCFLLATLLSLTAIAQKKFDSASYVSFNQNKWEKVSYADVMKEGAINENLSAEEKIAGLSRCWAEAKYNFANFDLVPHLNWDSIYQAYIPRVAAATSTLDYYKVLKSFYQHLRDGHTSIAYPFAYMKQKNGIVPLEIRWIEGKAIVVQNTSQDPADGVIKPGMEVVQWNGQPLAEYIQHNISPYLHFSTPQDSTERIYRYELTPGKGGSKVSLTLRTAEGRLFTKELTYKTVERYWDRYPAATFNILEGNIGYLQLNSFGSADVVRIFDSLFSSIAKTDALIIDVRNNGGGNGQNGFEILGCLTDKPFYPGKAAIRAYHPVGRAWGNPEGAEINGYDWKPYKPTRYTKPVAVLTSGATYSAAEDFTATFQGMKRGVVIGEPTGGSTGQPVMFMLPAGGTGRVCAKRDYFSDGTEFVGIGIQPDILVRPTIKSIAAGKDDVLIAALHHLQKK